LSPLFSADYQSSMQQTNAYSARALRRRSRASKFREGETLAKASTHAMNEIGGIPRRVFAYSAAFHFRTTIGVSSGMSRLKRCQWTSP
jgi:hypothetical protein